MLLNLRKHGCKDSPEYRAEIRTFGQFKDYLSQITGIPREHIQVKLGEPPVAVDYADDLPLADTPIHHQADVVVAWRDEAPPPQSAARSCLHAGSGSVDRKLSGSPAAAPVAEAGSFWGGGWFGSGGAESVQAGDGHLVRRRVPSDDSCLFSSLAACLGRPGLAPQQLRALVSEAIAANPDTYSEAVLEKPVREYCEWITKPSSWGGGIEMAIISEMFHIEICSIDTRTRRTDRFGEGRYCRRVYLLYTGSHYDYVALASSPTSPREFDQTEFKADAADASEILSAAIALAGKAR
ncbi:ubiquitin-specific protease otu1 [Coemansia biformis]|uniref:Ubiquitin thioesterase OTU n=1 Tax=Coemansia biformis TaxID=1286918 RepID=A0A9W7YDI5_9FUNG|nr:ubiquitin-specific protease otu1 [Coemansia biformis]